MMSSLNRYCRLPDSKVIRRLSAHCHLKEMAADIGSQIHYYRYILLSLLVCGISTFSTEGGGQRGGFRKALQETAGRTNYSANVDPRLTSCSGQSLLRRLKKINQNRRPSMKSWFTVRFDDIDLHRLETIKNHQC